jgi:hypothetical protein
MVHICLLTHKKADVPPWSWAALRFKPLLHGGPSLPWNGSAWKHGRGDRAYTEGYGWALRSLGEGEADPVVYAIGEGKTS